MLGKLKYLYGAVLVVIGCLISSSVNAEELYKILETKLDNASNMFVINGNSPTSSIQYSGGKLINPDRVFIDINNSILVGPKQIVNIEKSKVKNITLSQFSVNPYVVRMVITADSKDTLSKINVAKFNNSIMFKFDNLKPKIDDSIITLRDTKIKTVASDLKPHIAVAQKQTVKPQTVKILGKNFLINNITVNSGHLYLAGVGKLDVKPPFTLSSPTRLVYDISNAQLAKADLVKTLTLNKDNTARIGMLDATTVRIVIDTKTPEKYKKVLAPDMQSMIIATGDNLIYSDLIDSGTKAKIQKIESVKVDCKATQLTIKSLQPFVHDVKRTASSLEIVLYNSTPPSKEALAAIKTTDQFSGMQSVKIGNAFKLTIPVKSGINAESGISYDGKTIKVVLTDTTPPPKAVDISVGCGKRIVLDAGHGGYDVGAVGGGIYEKDINLDVAKRVKKYLNDAGVGVVMTRSTDETLSLKDRTDITAAQKPDVFVSIHVNSSEGSQSKGLETHWYHDNSKTLAELIQESITSNIASPDRGIIKSKFYVINHTSVPAVLVEIGFISNERERCQMMTESRKDATAKSIAKGILMYLSPRYQKEK